MTCGILKQALLKSLDNIVSHLSIFAQHRLIFQQNQAVQVGRRIQTCHTSGQDKKSKSRVEMGDFNRRRATASLCNLGRGAWPQFALAGKLVGRDVRVHRPDSVMLWLS